VDKSSNAVGFGIIGEKTKTGNINCDIFYFRKQVTSWSIKNTLEKARA
jgi:hypothetical protein